MAAGITAKQRYGQIYRRLRSIQRDLERSGVEVSYRDRLLTDPSGNFAIHYYTLHASNGESASLPCIRFSTGETYRFMDFDKGLQVLKSRHGKQPCGE